MKANELADTLIAALEHSANVYANNQSDEFSRRSSLKWAHEAGCLRGWISRLMYEMTEEQLANVSVMVNRIAQEAQ